MNKYKVITKIMESYQIGENDKVYYIEMFLKGCYTEEEIKWIWEESESYTAFLYKDDMECSADLSTFNREDEAVKFAKDNNWDEVMNDTTGETVWSRYNS